VRFWAGRLFVEGLGHQVAGVIREAAAAVEFDGGVAVSDFEVKEFGVVFARGGLGEVKKLGANALSAMRSFDEEFINPCAFAAVFEAVVEADHQVADRVEFFADDVDDAVTGILQKFVEIHADRGFVKGLRPWIVLLHMAHHQKQGIEICGSGTCDGDGHEMRGHLCRKNEIGEEDHTTVGKLTARANDLPGRWQGSALHPEQGYPKVGTPSMDLRGKIEAEGATRFRRKLSRPGGMPGANHP